MNNRCPRCDSPSPELYEAMVASMEDEVRRYEQTLSRRHNGATIKLM